MGQGVDVIRLSSASADRQLLVLHTRDPAVLGTYILCMVNTFRRNENGATATEYAMLIVFVALAIATGAQTLGGAELQTSLIALEPPLRE